MIRTIRDGRRNTAMKAFAGILSDADINAVARFIDYEFIRCDGANTRYHSAENGWPDHARRNGAAFPFVTGAKPVDAAPQRLSAAERRGLAIFRKSCVVCHEATHAEAAPGVDVGAIERLPVGTAASAQGLPDHQPGDGDAEIHHDGHDESYGHGAADYGEYESSDHDRIPSMIDPTPSELAGQGLYQESCALCHAADGTGRNWIGRFLEPHPPNLTEPKWSQQVDDNRLRQAILDGRPGTSMPAFRAVLSKAEAEAIIDYMRRVFRR